MFVIYQVWVRSHTFFFPLWANLPYKLITLKDSLCTDTLLPRSSTQAVASPGRIYTHPVYQLTLGKIYNGCCVRPVFVFEAIMKRCAVCVCFHVGTSCTGNGLILYRKCLSRARVTRGTAAWLLLTGGKVEIEILWLCGTTQKQCSLTSPGLPESIPKAGASIPHLSQYCAGKMRSRQHSVQF